MDGDGARRDGSDALALDLTDVSSVTAWIEEAGLDPPRPLERILSTDEAVTVRLATESHVRPVEVPPSNHELTVDGCGGTTR